MYYISLEEKVFISELHLKEEKQRNRSLFKESYEDGGIEWLDGGAVSEVLLTHYPASHFWCQLSRGIGSFLRTSQNVL